MANDLSKELENYIANLTITQGDGEGDPFRILPWQRAFIRGTFKKKVESAALTMARGNGKSSFIAALACAALSGPLAVKRGETIIVASSFEQGRIVFDHVLAMLRTTGENLEDRKRWKVLDSTNRASIENKTTGARIRCIGSDPKRAHGLAPGGLGIIADEPAQWPSQTSNRMYSALRTSLGKIPGAKLIALGTKPSDRDHWFEVLLRNPLAFSMDYSATEEQREKEPYKLATIKAANPSYSYMPTLKKRLAREVDEAKNDPALATQFRALRLNGGVSDVDTSALIDVESWRSIEKETGYEARGPVVWGVDLAGGAAMSALAFYWIESGRLEAIAAFPEKPSLPDREKRDGADGIYTKMNERGELLTIGEHAVDLPSLLRLALEKTGPPACITGDRWKEADLLQALENAGIPRCPWLPRGQGYKDGSEDVRAFQRACAEGVVSPVESLLLRSAMREARVMSDPARNQKLAKASEGGRRQNARDDAAAASILAVAAGYRERQARGLSL